MYSRSRAERIALVDGGEVSAQPTTSSHLFLLGQDYHLGDLLWLTAVLAAYRRERQPGRLLVGLPDRPISRILEHSPVIDELLYGEPSALLRQARQHRGPDLVVHDLRPLSLAVAMIRDVRYRLPWLYYRDLWLGARGQWLATFLRLDPLVDFQPSLHLTPADQTLAHSLPARYVVFAPRVGQYTVPLAGRFWRRVKGWPEERWIELAERFRAAGYEPVTVAGADQTALPGTIGLMGRPIRQVAGVIDRAALLVTVESGLWYIAAARRTPFVIVPWWLPRSVNWPAWMNVPHRVVYREQTSVPDVLFHARALLDRAAG